MDDLISRQSIKKKLQEHHDFFIKAYGGFKNLPLNDKSRVDEITNCIAEIVNEPSVQPEPFINKPCISKGVCHEDKMKVLEKIKAEIKALSPKVTDYDVVNRNPTKEVVWETLDDVLHIINKYIAESEAENDSSRSD